LQDFAQLFNGGAYHLDLRKPASLGHFAVLGVVKVAVGIAINDVAQEIQRELYGFA
jgi:hypothetical protein